MNQKSGWHVSSWSFLGWLETIIKLFAFLCAYYLLFRAFGVSGTSIPFGLPLIIWVIQVLLSVGLLAAIADRLQYKDIISMIFLIFNILAHWSIVFVFLKGFANNFWVILFWALMLAGDLVKMIFLRTTDFSVRNVSKSVLYGLTLFYIGGYVLMLLFTLI